jgi:hypothetical protein
MQTKTNFAVFYGIGRICVERPCIEHALFLKRGRKEASTGFEKKMRISIRRKKCQKHALERLGVDVFCDFATKTGPEKVPFARCGGPCSDTGARRRPEGASELMFNALGD